jgi:hypothetical protein
MRYRTLGRTGIKVYLLDQIDEIVPPGSDVGRLDQACPPPALLDPSLRRRPVGERTAA